MFYLDIEWDVGEKLHSLLIQRSPAVTCRDSPQAVLARRAARAIAAAERVLAGRSSADSPHVLVLVHVTRAAACEQPQLFDAARRAAVERRRASGQAVVSRVGASTLELRLSGWVQSGLKRAPSSVLLDFVRRDLEQGLRAGRVVDGDEPDYIVSITVLGCVHAVVAPRPPRGFFRAAPSARGVRWGSAPKNPTDCNYGIAGSRRF